MKRLWIALLSLCLVFPQVSPAAEADSPQVPPLPDGLLPIVVFLHRGNGDQALVSTLLIVVNQHTGKSLKATLHPDLLDTPDFQAHEAATIQALLGPLGEKMALPLEKYACLELSALDPLETGEAKDKGPWEVIQLGFSLLGAVNTNLSIGQALSLFQRVFAQKEQGMALWLPEGKSADEPLGQTPDWAAIRETLQTAILTLGDSPT